MRLTTRPAPLDVAALFPELAGRARTTVRLHPRRGAPTTSDSCLGGPLLWPRDEPWPVCPVPDIHDPSEGWDPLPLVPVLQLFARDVPEVPFPGDTDLLQVLWCPVDHDMGQPYPVVRWRRAGAVADRLASMPEPDPDSDESYLPIPCVLSPERVQDYPHLWELAPDLREQVLAWEDGAENREGLSYHGDLSTAPGSKVGGWVHWLQDPVDLECPKGHVMDHLLTISSWELHVGNARRWAPREDGNPEDAHRSEEIQNPTGLMVLGAGSLYLFVCRVCPDRPTEHSAQR